MNILITCPKLVKRISPCQPVYRVRETVSRNCVKIHISFYEYKLFKSKKYEQSKGLTIETSINNLFRTVISPLPNILMPNFRFYIFTDFY